MKKISFIVLMSLAVSVLSACNPISGVLEVVKPFKVLITEQKEIDDIFCQLNPDDNCPRFEEVQKETVIASRSYSAELDIQSKKQILLTLKDGDLKKKITFKLPKGKEIPKYYGSISLSSEQIGQPFDIHGEVDTEHSRSEQKYTTESCSYTVRERVCRVRNIDRGDCRANRRGRKVCRPQRERVCEVEYVTRYGRQEVEFHYEYTKTNVNLAIVEMDSSIKMAAFTGSQTSWDKVYDYQGHCY